MQRAGILAAAAAVGALVGFGVRGGASLGRLGVVTLRLRGLPEFVAPDRGAVGTAMLGGAHVAVVSGLWGACAAALLGALARRGMGWPVLAAAAVLCALGLTAIDALLPTPLRLAAGSLGPAERALVAVLTTLAGAAAVRLAGPHAVGPRA